MDGLSPRPICKFVIGLTRANSCFIEMQWTRNAPNTFRSFKLASTRIFLQLILQPGEICLLQQTPARSARTSTIPNHLQRTIITAIIWKAILNGCGCDHGSGNIDVEFRKYFGARPDLPSTPWLSMALLVSNLAFPALNLACIPCYTLAEKVILTQFVSALVSLFSVLIWLGSSGNTTSTIDTWFVLFGWSLGGTSTAFIFSSTISRETLLWTLGANTLLFCYAFFLFLWIQSLAPAGSLAISGSDPY